MAQKKGIMIRKIVLLLFIVIAFSANGQNRELVLNFEPSFLPSSILTVKRYGGETMIKIQFQEEKETGTVSRSEERSLNNDDFNRLMGFLSTYQFKVKGNVDTVGTYERVTKGIKTIHYLISWGNDGVTVKGTLREIDKEKKFAFWSPKTDTSNHQLTMQIFELMNKNFKRKYTKQYLAELKKYF
ncbi:MAG: hypothetical protein ACO1NZ_16825 [Adhaeribacter sp.]